MEDLLGLEEKDVLELIFFLFSLGTRREGRA